MAFLGLLLSLSLPIVALLFYGYSAYASVAFFSKPQRVDASFTPPVTILKPLCGLDHGLYENLATFCRQDYPVYQLIFGVRDQSDPAIDMVQQIIRDFPTVDIKLVVDDYIIGSNLKVSNLANLEPFAKYHLILSSDSDIRVGPDYLKRMVQPMASPRTGVVTCLYRSRVRGRVAALEALSISTEFHACVLAARKLGWMKFAMGSSILMRRSVLQEIGGFQAIANHLADDFMLGNLAARAGYRVVLSDYIVEHTLETSSLWDLVTHQTRWNRCTRFSNPGGYWGLFFTHGTALSLGFLLFSHESGLGWIVLSLVWTVRLFTGWLLGVWYLKDKVATRLLWLVPLRDLLSFGLWSYGLLGNQVWWRGQKFRILKGGTLFPIGSGQPLETTFAKAGSSLP